MKRPALSFTLLNCRGGLTTNAARKNLGFLVLLMMLVGATGAQTLLHSHASNESHNSCAVCKTLASGGSAIVEADAAVVAASDIADCLTFPACPLVSTFDGVQHSPRAPPLCS